MPWPLVDDPDPSKQDLGHGHLHSFLEDSCPTNVMTFAPCAGRSCADAKSGAF